MEIFTNCVPLPPNKKANRKSGELEKPGIAGKIRAMAGRDQGSGGLAVSAYSAKYHHVQRCHSPKFLLSCAQWNIHESCRVRSLKSRHYMLLETAIDGRWQLRCSIICMFTKFPRRPGQMQPLVSTGFKFSANRISL